MDTLLHAALSNAAVVIVLAAVVSLFGRFSRRPALVHSLWLVVFLKLLTPPLWPVSVSGFVHSEDAPVAIDLAVHEPSGATRAVGSLSRSARIDQGIGDAEQSPPRSDAILASEPPGHSPLLTAPAAELSPAEEPTLSASAAPSTISWAVWLLTIWLSGSALWVTLAGYRLSRFHRLLRLTQPAPANLQSRAHRLAKQLELARCPGVWTVSAPISPLLWAFLGEPRVLVPAFLLDRLTEEQWDTLLAHELAHLRRRDHWVRLLELAVIGLYWWHPVVWWGRHKLREAEERCCDAWVVWALPGAAEVYASTLVEAVTYLSGARSALPLAASGIGQMHLLKRRLTMIMHGTTPRALSAGGSLAVFGLAAVLLPLYPTLARTQGAGRAEQQQPASAARAAHTAGVPAGGIAAAEEPEVVLPPTGRDKNYPETVEDAQDDVELLRVQLDLRRAERREVQARLRQAQVDLQRYQRLAGNGGVSSDTVEHAQTEVVVQEARLAAKDAQIKEAELRLRQAERRLVRFHSRTVAPSKSSSVSKERPSGSAIPPPQQRLGGGIGLGGGTGGSGGISGGINGGIGGIGSFSGGIGGGLGNFGGMAGHGGNPSTFEHRLAEVEKKLQTLMDEMMALRKERRRGPRESEQKRP